MNTYCQLTSFRAHQVLHALAFMCMPLYILTVWTQLFDCNYSQGTESSLQSMAAWDAITTIKFLEPPFAPDPVCDPQVCSFSLSIS